MSNERFQKSSGNVFADLGLDEAPGLYLRGLLGMKIAEFFERMQRDGKTQCAISKLAKTTQPRVSALINGSFSGTSIEKMVTILAAIGSGIDVLVTQPNEEVDPKPEVYDKNTYVCNFLGMTFTDADATPVFLDESRSDYLLKPSENFIASTCQLA